jgi:hypothetical protein
LGFPTGWLFTTHKDHQLHIPRQLGISSIQLIRTFIERRVQPLAARAHCMWDYSDRWDPTRVSSDELKEAEIDDGVCAITNLKINRLCRRFLVS